MANTIHLHNCNFYLNYRKITFIFSYCCFLAKIYPRGFAGSMREYSDKFHQIYCWNEHYEDYKTILLDLFKFLKVNV